MAIYRKTIQRFAGALVTGRKRVLLFLIIAVVFAAVAQQLGSGLVFNLTTSVDGTLFVKQPDKHIERGSIVFFPFKHPVLPNGVDHMTKKVMCLPGDVLRRDGLNFYCNGKLIARAKTHTRQGAPLQALEWHVGVIPEGKFFAASPNPDGFDSRYYGFIPLNSATVVELIL